MVFSCVTKKCIYYVLDINNLLYKTITKNNHKASCERERKLNYVRIKCCIIAKLILIPFMLFTTNTFYKMLPVITERWTDGLLRCTNPTWTTWVEMLNTVLTNNKLWWGGLKFNNLFLLDTSVHHFKMAAFQMTLVTGFPKIFTAK